MEPFLSVMVSLYSVDVLLATATVGLTPSVPSPAVGACWAWIAFWTLYAGLSLGACFPLVAARNGKVQHRGGGCAGIGDGGV